MHWPSLDLDCQSHPLYEDETPLLDLSGRYSSERPIEAPSPWSCCEEPIVPRLGKGLQQSTHEIMLEDGKTKVILTGETVFL